MKSLFAGHNNEVEYNGLSLQGPLDIRDNRLHFLIQGKPDSHCWCFHRFAKLNEEASRVFAVARTYLPKISSGFDSCAGVYCRSGFLVLYCAQRSFVLKMIQFSPLISFNFI